MPKYRVYWDELTTYYIEVEADSPEDAQNKWSDPACWETEPEGYQSEYAENFDVEEM